LNQYIPLCVPSLKGNEIKYVKECIDTEWVSSAGEYVEKFELAVANYTNAKFAVACINGTSALQVSLSLAGVKPNDEVIAPTLTFIAPINAIMYNFAKPVFMDSDRYYNIDIEKTINFIKNETVYKNGFSYNRSTKKRISAIVPVHVWGNACFLDELVVLCKERNIAIVEDASESLGTHYKKGNYLGKHTGTIGTLGCISFNGNKVITSGGGGMILTNDEKLATKAKYLTTQAKDDPIRYRHDEIGYNFRLPNIQAAIGLAQMEQLDKIIEKKEKIHNIYKKKVNKMNGLNIASTPAYSNNNYWLNILQVNDSIYGLNCENLSEIFEKNKVQTRPVWFLNHNQRPYKNCQVYQIENAKILLRKSLCLPSSSNLKKNELEKIINCL
tara:strand:+ start:354 stop:1508 length:1155 start_codon:yes stop_codon:yes gene_type:complete